MKPIKLVAIMIFALIPAVTLTRAFFFTVDASRNFSLESAIHYSIPFQDELLWLRNRINLSGGRREIIPRDYYPPDRSNGIFASENGLMKNIDAPVQVCVDENIESIAKFAEEMRQSRKETYLALIPTSGAILQQNLPRFATSVMTNQRQFIDDAYSRMAGSAVTVDTYSQLFAKRSQYIYYRTENNLTSLGGFCVYAAITSRMGLGSAQLKQFDIEYVGQPFYGELTKITGYKSTPADTISLFRYNGTGKRPHEFLVTHENYKGTGTKTYHTLYPPYAAESGRELDVFLGGYSQIIDIAASTGSSVKILAFVDGTAISYAPLLANNCGRLTLVNLDAFGSDLQRIDLNDYDKFLFCYSAETFMQTNTPAKKALAFLEGY